MGEGRERAGDIGNRGDSRLSPKNGERDDSEEEEDGDEGLESGDEGSEVGTVEKVASALMERKIN